MLNFLIFSKKSFRILYAHPVQFLCNSPLWMSHLGIISHAYFFSPWTILTSYYLILLYPHYVFPSNSMIPLTKKRSNTWWAITWKNEWDKIISSLCSYIIGESSFSRLLAIRWNFFDILFLDLHHLLRAFTTYTACNAI